MEEEGKKTSRWAESLGEAGLLDEIEDSWSLPPDRPVEGSTITVKGSSPELGEVPSSKDTKRLRSSKPSSAAGAGEKTPRTPVERRRSSDPRQAAPADAADPPLARPTEPAVKRGKAEPETPKREELKTAPLRVRKAKETIDGIPSRQPPQPVASIPPREEPQVEIEPLPDEPERPLIELEPEPEPAGDYAAIEIEERDAAVVSVRGARISVPPDRPEADEPVQPEIVDRPPPPLEPEKTPRQLMAERYELGDYSGALELAEGLLRDDPDDVEAADFAESCKEVLTQMYEARIGSFDRVPQVAVSEHELIWRDLDPAAGFVLSRIDGFSTYEDIIDISGMPRFETCRILGQLLQEGIIK